MIMRQRVLPALLVALAATSGTGGLSSAEENFNAWRYRREVVPAEERGVPGARFARIVLPPEVVMESRIALRDVRLVGANGRVVPYIQDEAVLHRSVKTWAAKLVDTRQVAEGTMSVWVADLGAKRRFDEAKATIPDQDFARRAELEGSPDRRTWTRLARDAGLFDARWGRRIHHTAIEVPAGSEARYLRLTIDNGSATPVTVSGLQVMAVEGGIRETWRREVDLIPETSERGVSRYRLDLRHGFPIDRVELVAADGAFARAVRLVEEWNAPGTGAIQRKTWGQGDLYRWRRANVGGEMLSFYARGRAAPRMILEVEDQDSPPLRDVGLVISGTSTRLLFSPDHAGERLVLYYANPVAEAPKYDLERLRSEFTRERLLVTYSVGAEETSRPYERAVPMDFLPARGAAIDPLEWKRARALRIGMAPDIYAVSLAPVDLAWLRPDLNDIRLVDEGGNQVPYVLERDVAQVEVPMEVREAKPGGHSAERASEYVLVAELKGTEGKAAVPIQRIDLEFSDRYFSRRMRLEVEDSRGGEKRARSTIRNIVKGRIEPQRGGRTYTTLWNGSVTKEADESGPVRAMLGGSRRREFVLRIENGDNRPLSLRSAVAFVPVPRVSFKLDPAGERFQLLLGNASARRPDYELQRLRSEILDFDAAEASLGPLVSPFKAGERIDVSGAPASFSSLVLWGVIAVTVVALLVVTFWVARPPSKSQGT